MIKLNTPRNSILVFNSLPIIFRSSTGYTFRYYCVISMILFWLLRRLSAISGLDKLRIRYRSCTLRRAKPLNRPIFWAYTFSLGKKKISFDLIISSHKDKAMTKLQWIPNTIVSISVLVICWYLHIWWCQTDLSTQGLRKI